jgi:hypothetical protein
MILLILIIIVLYLIDKINNLFKIMQNNIDLEKKEET